MFHHTADKKTLRIWAITVIGIAIALLAVIQMVRVNQPQREIVETKVYTTSGPVVSGQVVVAGNDFYSTRIDLNRRAKLAGSFHTGKIRNKVSAIVMNEQNFEAWKSKSEYRALAETGYLPGGKIHLILEPGVYFLVIDNTPSEEARSVRADFSLE